MLLHHSTAQQLNKFIRIHMMPPDYGGGLLQGVNVFCFDGLV